MISTCEPMFSTSTRPEGPLACCIRQAREHYARRHPGHGQKSLFDDEPAVQSRQGKLEWDEKLHPREADGEFAKKGEGEMKRTAGSGQEAVQAAAEAKAIRDAKTREEDLSNATEPGSMAADRKRKNREMLPTAEEIGQAKADMAEELKRQISQHQAKKLKAERAPAEKSSPSGQNSSDRPLDRNSTESRIDHSEHGTSPEPKKPDQGASKMERLTVEHVAGPATEKQKAYLADILDKHNAKIAEVARVAPKTAAAILEKHKALLKQGDISNAISTFRDKNVIDEAYRHAERVSRDKEEKEAIKPLLQKQNDDFNKIPIHYYEGTK